MKFPSKIVIGVNVRCPAINRLTSNLEDAFPTGGFLEELAKAAPMRSAKAQNARTAPRKTK